MGSAPSARARSARAASVQWPRRRTGDVRWSRGYLQRQRPRTATTVSCAGGRLAVLSGLVRSCGWGNAIVRTRKPCSSDERPGGRQLPRRSACGASPRSATCHLFDRRGQRIQRGAWRRWRPGACGGELLRPTGTSPTSTSGASSSSPNLAPDAVSAGRRSTTGGAAVGADDLIERHTGRPSDHLVVRGHDRCQLRLARLRSRRRRGVGWLLTGVTAGSPADGTGTRISGAAASAAFPECWPAAAAEAVLGRALRAS